MKEKVMFRAVYGVGTLISTYCAVRTEQSLAKSGDAKKPKGHTESLKELSTVTVGLAHAASCVCWGLKPDEIKLDDASLAKYPNRLIFDEAVKKIMSDDNSHKKNILGSIHAISVREVNAQFIRDKDDDLSEKTSTELLETVYKYLEGPIAARDIVKLELRNSNNFELDGSTVGAVLHGYMALPYMIAEVPWIMCTFLQKPDKIKGLDPKVLERNITGFLSEYSNTFLHG